MMNLVKIFLAVTCLSLAACATHTSIGEDFGRSVKAYNRMLRWHEIESAGMTYVDPELRDEFLKQTESLKKRGLSVTDFRIIYTKYIPESASGIVTAEFDYYILPSNTVKTISNRQDWVYREKSKSWMLRSGLAAFE